MKVYLLPLLMLSACAYGVDAPSTTSAPEQTDGGQDAAPAATTNTPDARAEAGGSHTVCCQTDQNLLVCAPGAPWTCLLPGTTHPAVACDLAAVSCAVGDACQGLQGWGTVVPCGL